jgi:hypothetical protein
VARGLAIHPTTGDIYVTGLAGNIPTIKGAQPLSGGGDGDAFVARVASTPTILIQATYLGGSGSDEARSVVVHPSTGDIYVAGSTTSTNFPGAPGGAQAAGGVGFDAFIARLPSTLTSLTQATYLGGTFDDVANALAIHPATGDIYAAGTTNSTNFPGTVGGVQPVNGGGGNGDGSSTLSALTQATYLGGGFEDMIFTLAIHPATDHVFVAGATGSTDLPGTTGGAQPAARGEGGAFVARLTSNLAHVARDLTITKMHGGHFIRRAAPDGHARWPP